MDTNRNKKYMMHKYWGKIGGRIEENYIRI